MTRRKTPTSAINHRPKSPEPHRRIIFTERDEIELLKTLTQSPNQPNSYNPPNFTSTQISKKIKRLKEKYHKLARSKSLIKTSHDNDIYELGRPLWGRNAIKEKHQSFEGSVIWEDFPFLMNEMKEIFERNDGYFKEGLRRLGKKKLKEMNEKWMEWKVEESVYSTIQRCHLWDHTQGNVAVVGRVKCLNSR